MLSINNPIKPLRKLISIINLSIVNQNYEQVPSMIHSVLPKIQVFSNDEIALSKIIVNFDFHCLFSYLFLMNQTNLDLKDSILFLSIIFKSQVFDPKYLLNKQNMILIYSLLDQYSNNAQIVIDLLSVLCKLTTPYSQTYRIFVNNDLFHRTISFKQKFPISHIFYHVVLSAFNDNYKLDKKFSIMILKSALQTLQFETNPYGNDQFYQEEIAFSLKLFAIYIKNSVFPIDFNTMNLLHNSQHYLKGPEIIQESFLDFIDSYDSVDAVILNEIIPFFIDRNKKSSLLAVKIFKKSLFQQSSDDDEYSDDDDSNNNDDNKLDLSSFPNLPNIISQLYRVEPIVIQNEAFLIVGELCKNKIINSDLFRILCTRIPTEYASIEIISKLIDEFKNEKKTQIGFLALKDFYQILSNYSNDLNQLFKHKSYMQIGTPNNQLLVKILHAIDSYNESLKNS